MAVLRKILTLYVVDVTGYYNPGFYGNFPPILPRVWHAVGLQHQSCSGGQMPVNEMKPQTLSFSLKELAMIALIHDDRFPTGSDKSFDQTREALGIIMDDNVQAYLDDPDLHAKTPCMTRPGTTLERVSEKRGHRLRHAY